MRAESFDLEVMMVINRKILIFANILTPIVCFGILSFFSIGEGDYNQIFRPTGNESLIDPAGFTFAIWGPIFALLFMFIVYQARGLFKNSVIQSELTFVDQVSVFFVISTILTSFWYLAWLHRIIWLATIFMVLYLISLVITYLRLNINRVERPKKEKWTVVAPWSMYTAWVTTAAIVSITTFLVSVGFNNPPLIFSDTLWAVLVLLVALVIYLSVLVTRNDPIFAGVGIWALLGILLERLTAPSIVLEIILTAIIGITVLSIAIIYQVARKQR
jgi:hypothetical protein